jgi:AcrR family transcriptional regulator
MAVTLIMEHLLKNEYPFFIFTPEACQERIFVLFYAMPKISDEKRAARRQQILNAAWACFQRNGLHATTMDDIIREAGLSAGAVYSYFRNKDDLIRAAVTTSLSGLGAVAAALLARDRIPPPDRLVEELAQAIEDFTDRDGFDLKRIALLGWSEAQRNEELRGLMRTFYASFRDQLAAAVKSWQADAVIEPAASPDDVARALLALIFGYVVEAAVVGGVGPASLRGGLIGLRSPG